MFIKFAKEKQFQAEGMCRALAGLSRIGVIAKFDYKRHRLFLSIINPTLIEVLDGAVLNLCDVIDLLNMIKDT
jgi:hypothetical protein